MTKLFLAAVFLSGATPSPEAGGLLGVLAEYGVLAVLLAIFIWRDMKREKAGEERREADEERDKEREEDMRDRIRSLEDKHSETLSTLVVDNHKVITDNTAALTALTEALKARPCITPDNGS